MRNCSMGGRPFDVPTRLPHRVSCSTPSRTPLYRSLAVDQFGAFDMTALTSRISQTHVAHRNQAHLPPSGFRKESENHIYRAHRLPSRGQKEVRGSCSFVLKLVCSLASEGWILMVKRVSRSSTRTRRNSLAWQSKILELAADVDHGES